MPLRYVKDLNEEQWAFLMKRLKEGPTPKQKEFVRKAVEMFKDKKVDK